MTAHPMDKQCMAFVAAHTAPFNEPATWQGEMPRLPDGHKASTNVEQIRFQSYITTDYAGRFHIICPGDPFQWFLPIIDHTMCVNYALTQANTTAWSAQPVNQVQSGAPFMNSYQLGDTTATNQNPIDPGTWAQGTRLGTYINSMNTIVNAYTTNYPGLIAQMMSAVRKYSKTRPIGQALRIWSLQGELLNNTGTIRAAGIDPTTLSFNWETRQPWAVTECFNVFAVPNSSDPGLGNINTAGGGSSYPRPSAVWLDPTASTNPSVQPQNSLAANSLYGGIASAQWLDWEGNRGDYTKPNGNDQWWNYLKATTEGAELPWSYKMYDGRNGICARSGYTTTSVKFKDLRPKTVLTPIAFETGIANTTVAVGVDSTVLCQTIKTGNGSPGDNQYQLLYCIKDACCVPLGAWNASSTTLYPTVVPGFPYTGVSSQGYNVSQTSALCGLDATDNGWPKEQTDADFDFMGFHAAGTNYQPLTNMYFEYVYTYEGVPIQAQTGLVSSMVEGNPSFKHVLMMVMDTTHFPLTAPGHSFWKHLEDGISKMFAVAQKIKSRLGIFSNLIPGASFI